MQLHELARLAFKINKWNLKWYLIDEEDEA